MPVVLQRCISKEELEKGHCYVPAGTQFTCFTSTVMCLQVTQFTCYASTKVQILILEELRVPTDQCYVPLGTQFTCFTASEVQILTR
jgi:hypothetical protein